MNQSVGYSQNEAAFRRLKPTIDARYTVGHFVAFDGGEIVADAATYSDLEKTLVAAGKKSRDMFVVQAGVEYPEHAAILFLLQPV